MEVWPNMYAHKAGELFRTFDEYELGLCLRLNRASAWPSLRGVFRVASRLGDGVFWYTLMALLPVLFGTGAWLASVHMAVVGVTGVLLYKLLKTRMVRERPFVTHAAINLGTAPLDQYSFPSGHTLHAVSFTLVATAYYPVLAWLLLPFAALVMLSRVVLGLHYPTDVVAGAVIGALLAYASFLPL
jgi:undecaprenyl-diphosphatase